MNRKKHLSLNNQGTRLTLFLKSPKNERNAYWPGLEANVE